MTYDSNRPPQPSVSELAAMLRRVSHCLVLKDKDEHDTQVLDEVEALLKSLGDDTHG